jgi:hypothetical protein
MYPMTFCLCKGHKQTVKEGMTADLSDHNDNRHSLGARVDQADGGDKPVGHGVCRFHDQQIRFLEDWCRYAGH